MKEEKEKNSAVTLRVAFKRIFVLSKPYRKLFYTGILLTVLASAVWLTVPLGLRALLDAVFQNTNKHMLNMLTVGLLGLFLLQAVLSFVGNYWLEWVGERVITDLRKRLYEHLQHMGFMFFANTRLGEITSRLTNDVSSIRTAVTDSMPEMLTTIFSLIGSLALMIYLNWRLSAVIFLTVPAVTLATRYFGNRIRVLARRVQDRLADTTSVAEEALGAVRIVKAFAREPYEIKRYNESVESLFQTARRKILVTTLFWSGIGLMFMTVLVIIFWFGGFEVLAGRLTTGDLVAFIFYAFNISRSVGMLSRLYTTFNTAAGATDRIFELLLKSPEIVDEPGAENLPRIEGRVDFNRVEFAYEKGRSVLYDISFTVNPGETVAIVGPSGAGKTTLMHLIPRFFDPVSGQITIDDYPITNVTTQSLREQIALVPQDVQLFSSSIRDNIRYGKISATDDEVVEAAKSANADTFISVIPGGYDARIGERGVKLSGGQRQRIALARAILKDPRILLLDEATSSLDSESESLVQEALDRIMHKRTSFIIAHRLSTVKHADRIIVLDNGRIVQDGTHVDLLRQGGTYKRLHDLQFREDEDVNRVPF
ncbi:MAG TPA: ABC transporter transmembrane domain-containing protein [Balneolales bacterium]|nr:ABC transporter transmembrane domain-containing protein [Balneolales bacterium]